MDPITLTFPYQGAIIESSIQPEDTIRGTVYPVDLNGNYHFTLYQNEEDDWCILKEADATIPFVEQDLYDKIIKKLQYELKYAA
jgi:hypothetical protein